MKKAFSFLILFIVITLIFASCEKAPVSINHTPPSGATPAVRPTKMPVPTQSIHTPGVDFPVTDEPGVGNDFGDVPAFISDEIMENWFIAGSVFCDDGYLIYNESNDNIYVEKYNFDRDLIWKERYAAIPRDSYPLINLIPTADGGYLLSISFYNTLSKVIKTSESFLFKCDKNGKESWSRKYLNLDSSNDAFTGLFESETGDIYVLSTKYITKSNGLNLRKSVYVEKLNKDGELVFSKNLGGSGDDYIVKAEYVKGYGIISEIHSTSPDGIFKSEQNMSPAISLVFFDMNMDLSWKKESRSAFSDLKVYDDNIYLVNGNYNTLYKLNISGDYDFNKSYSDIAILACNKMGIVLNKNRDIVVLDHNGNDIINTDFNTEFNGYSGDYSFYVSYIKDLKDRFIVMYEYSDWNSEYNSYKRVLPCFDYSGNLLWKKIDYTYPYDY